MKEQKYHIYLTNQERSEIIESLIDFKNLRMWISVRTRSSAVNPMRVKNCQKRNRGTWKDSRTS